MSGYRRVRETVQVPYTRDGITVEVEETREHLVPTLPRDWDVIAVRVATGLVLALTMVSVVWSTWSIGSLLRGGIGYAAAMIFDVAWAVCLILEWLARFDADKRATPRRLGWALLIVTMIFIGWHGLDVGQPGMAVVGATVSAFAKVLWLGVMKHVDRELSPADQAWVEAQISDAHARLAVAVARRQVARMEDKAVREMLAMEASRTRYGTAEVPPTAATVEVLPGPGTTGQPALTAPGTGTSGGTGGGSGEALSGAAGRLVRESRGDRDGVVQQVNAGSGGSMGCPGGIPEPADGRRDAGVPPAEEAGSGTAGCPGTAGGDNRHSSSSRGSVTQEIRSLIASGVTDTGTIRDRLECAGLKVPDPSYIRRLVRAAREDSRAPGQYL